MNGVDTASRHVILKSNAQIFKDLAASDFGGEKYLNSHIRHSESLCEGTNRRQNTPLDARGQEPKTRT